MSRTNLTKDSINSFLKKEEEMIMREAAAAANDLKVGESMRVRTVDGLGPKNYVRLSTRVVEVSMPKFIYQTLCEMYSSNQILPQILKTAPKSFQ